MSDIQPVTVSKEVIQSYLLTMSSRNWGIYAERMLLRLVEMAQKDIKMLDFRSGKDICAHEPSFDYPGLLRLPGGDMVVSIPVKDLLPSKDYTNYEFVREAVEQLQRQILRWESPKLDAHGKPILDKKGEIVRKWTSVQLIGKASGVTCVGSNITVRVDVDVWRAMVEFSKGFRAYDLDVALRLKSRYSLRFYQMMSRQTSPLVFSVEDLKRSFSLSEKYSRFDQFLRYVIVPAKKELDRVSPYSFNYELVRSSGPGRGKKGVEKIRFFPVHQVWNENPVSVGVYDDTSVIGEDVRLLLRDKFGFSDAEIHSVVLLFFEAKRRMSGDDENHPTLYVFLDTLHKYMGWVDVVPRNRQGYVVNALKKHLKERYGFVYRGKRGQMLNVE